MVELFKQNQSCLEQLFLPAQGLESNPGPTFLSKKQAGGNVISHVLLSSRKMLSLLRYSE